jgi:hypothetical protein
MYHPPCSVYDIHFSGSLVQADFNFPHSDSCMTFFSVQMAHVNGVSISVKLAVVSNFDTRLRKLLKDLNVSDV